MKQLRSETATASHDQYPGVDVTWLGQISVEKEKVVGSSRGKGADESDYFCSRANGLSGPSHPEVTAWGIFVLPCRGGQFPDEGPEHHGTPCLKR